MNLEQKYEDIQVKVIENNTKMTCKFNEIQIIITHLKNKHEVIEYIIKEISKTYTDIIKISIINTKKKVIIEIYIQQK